MMDEENMQQINNKEVRAFSSSNKTINFQHSNGMARPRIPGAVVRAQRSRQVGLFGILQSDLNSGKPTAGVRGRQDKACLVSGA